jgi:hypothetical protein
MTSKPSMLNTANFVGRVFPCITIGQLSTHFLQVTVSPTGMTMHIFCSKGSALRLHNFTNVDETKEWVALESNRIVPVTTSVAFSSTSTLPDVSE